jgi:hypothetical protein
MAQGVNKNTSEYYAVPNTERRWYVHRRLGGDG